MRTDEMRYFGIEKRTDTWKPAGIVAVPNDIHDALNTLRAAVGPTLRIVSIDSNVWGDVFKEKLVLDYNSFLIAVEVLG